MSEELKPCPFCGSPAMADSGFAPAESIIYAFCSNNDCRLHSVDVGLSPEEWNQRALPAINPQPPTVAITWHDSPESVHRAMWEESAVAAGMTYEQMVDESVSCGEDEHGNEIEFTHEQEIAGMRQQGCWAFVDARSNIIHAWADESASREFVLHMLAHEIGHITGDAHTDDFQEEMRAEQFGRVARAAYRLLPPVKADCAALEAECERLRVKLMTIASAEPARHGIEWAKAHAAEGNNEVYAKWREAIDEARALAAENAQMRNSMLRLVTTHCAAAIKGQAADAELEQYLAAGIAQLEGQRDKLAGELAAIRERHAIARRVVDRIGQLCTTPHESKERFIRRVQSVIEWEAQAINGAKPLSAEALQ